jgi:hypothetical protein
MADNIIVTPGVGATVAMDELVDGTLGTVKVQFVKIMDGTLDSSTKAAVGANGIRVDGSLVTQPVSIAGSVTVAQPTAANLKVDASGPWDKGSGTGGAVTQRVIMDSSQLAALSTTVQAMSAGYQLTALPSNQVVPNVVQAQNNGMTSSRVNAAATTNATSLKASAGALGNIDVFNVAAYSVFLKFYNKASAPTVGTDTPVWTIPIAAGTGYARSFPFGKWFSTGVAYAITKLQPDSDTTVVVAGDLTGAVDWI